MKKQPLKISELTELSWEEKYPVDYLFGPSDEDLRWLEEKIQKDEENIFLRRHGKSGKESSVSDNRQFAPLRKNR